MLLLLKIEISGAKIEDGLYSAIIPWIILHVSVHVTLEVNKADNYMTCLTNWVRLTYEN